MKAKSTNLIYLIVGIAAAVIVMNLIPNNKADSATQEPVKEEPPTELQPTPPETDPPAQKTETTNQANEEIVATEEAEEISAQEEANRITSLMDRMFSGQASDEEQMAFWEELRTSGAMNRIIDEQESKTPLESDDIQSHMDLAKLYVAKIWSVPAGPEKGLWASKAENRWKAVLEIDPNHWDARYSVGFSYSMYPDFMNKTGEAISEFETLLSVQREQDPDPKHAQTYLHLFRLYQKRGDAANAQDAINEGLEFFPGDKQLLEQKSSLSTLQ